MSEPIECPQCRALITQQYSLKNQVGEDKKELSVCNWYHCFCGYMFHLEEYKPSDIFTLEYKEKYLDKKFLKVRYEYLIRLYAQIIEEKTYGRRMLDVGCCGGHIVREFRKRGWIGTGIDLVENDFIQGDFETFDFDGERFDMIWMGNVIQCFVDPISAIQKAYTLLRPNGILFVETPNTDVIRAMRISDFGHWDMTIQKQFINERILRESLIKSDQTFKSRFQFLYFDPHVNSQRFITWNTMHMIGQKRCIEDIDAFGTDVEEAKEHVGKEKKIENQDRKEMDGKQKAKRGKKLSDS